MKFCMKHFKNRKIKPVWLYAGGVLLLMLSVLLGLSLGAAGLPPEAVLRALFAGDRSSPEAKILWFVRIPRVLGSLLCGGALAVAGAVLQRVLDNGLASPSIIGVNAGAGFAVTVSAAFGLMGGWQLSLLAFLGAFGAAMVVSLCARRWGASRSTVILLGVALNSFLGAMSDSVRSFVPEVSILSSDFRVGDFSAVTVTKLVPAAVIILLSIGALYSLTSQLDVLALGDEQAGGLGLRADRLRVLCLVLAAALSGAAVSVAGLLSFVGLIVPHVVRRLAGSEARHWLPLCALFGAGFVTLCDTASRVIFAPYEVPVGILMAFLGCPCFVLLLRQRKGGHGNA